MGICNIHAKHQSLLFEQASKTLSTIVTTSARKQSNERGSRGFNTLGLSMYGGVDFLFIISFSFRNILKRSLTLISFVLYFVINVCRMRIVLTTCYLLSINQFFCYTVISLVIKPTFYGILKIR